MTERIAGLAREIISHSKWRPSPCVRKEYRARKIHYSLAIEQNTLSLGQVAAISDGKRVLGKPVGIQEVQNAYKAYGMMLTLNPMSVDDLPKAHKQMMAGLIPENGNLRSKGVGVFDGNVVVHMAPPAEFVSGQIQDLFAWYKSS